MYNEHLPIIICAKRKLPFCYYIPLFYGCNEVVQPWPGLFFQDLCPGYKITDGLCMRNGGNILCNNWPLIQFLSDIMRSGSNNFHPSFESRMIRFSTCKCR